MHRALIAFAITTATFAFAGCHDGKSDSRNAAALAGLPEPPPPTRGSAASQEDVASVRAVVAELARRADANDEAYFASLMPGAEPAAAADMMRRVKRVDLNGTYAKH